jgi:hypothetical protein
MKRNFITGTMIAAIAAASMAQAHANTVAQQPKDKSLGYVQAFPQIKTNVSNDTLKHSFRSTATVITVAEEQWSK